MTPQQERSAKIAADLLRLGKMHPEDVMEYVGDMNQKDRDTLRGQVAWVNEYEAHEGVKK